MSGLKYLTKWFCKLDQTDCSFFRKSYCDKIYFFIYSTMLNNVQLKLILTYHEWWVGLMGELI